MNPLTIRVDLRPEELLRLDGWVREEVQEAVEIARAGIKIGERYSLSEARADLVARLVAEARAAGWLKFTHRSINNCWVCGRSGGYGGRKKDKPMTIAGFDCDTGFVFIQRTAALGGCDECLEAILPAARQELSSLRAQLPDILHLEGAPRWRRWDLSTCTACAWTGHEGQLGELPALMGGLYRGKCPKCGAENKPFGPTIIKNDPSPKAFFVELVPEAPAELESGGAQNEYRG